MTLYMLKKGVVELIQADHSQLSLLVKGGLKSLASKCLLIAEVNADQVISLPVNSADYTYIYSPWEALAGYLKMMTSNTNEEIQVLDIVDDRCYPGRISFDEHGRIKRANGIGSYIAMDTVSNDILGESSGVLTYLLDYLKQLGPNGIRNAQIISEAMQRFQAGQDEYDEIFQILDIPRLASLKLSKLILLRDTLFKMTATNPNMPFFVTGILGVLFGETKVDEANLEKIIGAYYIQNDLHSFYGTSTQDVALEVFLYPKKINIQIVQCGDDYKVYSTPIQVSVFDNGSINVNRNSVVQHITTTKMNKIIPCSIYMGGGQNIFVGMADRTYMIP